MADYDYESVTSLSSDYGGNDPPQRPPTGYGVPLAEPVGSTTSHLSNQIKDNSGTSSNYDKGSTTSIWKCATLTNKSKNAEMGAING